MAGILSKISDTIYAIVGLVAGIILLVIEEYLWGVIGLAAGIYLFYRAYRKSKSVK